MISSPSPSSLSIFLLLALAERGFAKQYRRTHTHDHVGVPAPTHQEKSVSSKYYEIEDSFVGESFLKGFDFFTGDDPTHGRVNYVDKKTALRERLVSFTDDSFIMRADSKHVVKPGARGRDSVRISSRKAYGHGLDYI
ncbi:hypothetical protein FRB94_001086 [Tulasnella sp. JGI-2019a]|nr:hypothetical protein FRB94_001086 [Tulasnella sp. JGI-2019a]